MSAGAGRIAASNVRAHTGGGNDLKVSLIVEYL